jgi:thiol-disulfide isomerase/thioredoxin
MASANPSVAQDYAAANDLRAGDMRKLIFAEPSEVSDIPFTTEDGTELTLADFEGKTIVLNFWATWCAPCRKEMPSLAELRAELSGETFDVVAVATGPKNEPRKIAKFFKANDVTDLPVYLDPKSRFANDMGVRGLPITVIINAAGQEIARMRGDAEWASENAKEVLNAIIERDTNS